MLTATPQGEVSRKLFTAQLLSRPLNLAINLRECYKPLRAPESLGLR